MSHDLKLSRRSLISSALITSAAVFTSPRLVLAAPQKATRSPQGAFSFILLGDMHFDRLAHHDREWVAREKPNDWRQIENYSRITTEMHPRLLNEVRDVIVERAQTMAPVRFVLQIGDVVEGLCGTPQLAQTQDGDALQWLRDAKLGAPFLFCKGNHDVTGPGSVEAYQQVFLPFLSEQLREATGKNTPVKEAYFAFEHEGVLFAFFDAYDNASLAWLETTLAQSRAQHKFVLIHPPVVPYGARSTWHLYSKPREAQLRQRLLSTLAANKALVLGGHIHKYNLSTRRFGDGRFVQLAINSVIPKATDAPDTILEGLEQYTPEQIRVEPNFSPSSEAERRATLEAEKPFVEYFEYADAPGYAIVTVDGDRVTAQIYSALGKNLWRSRDLTGLLRGA